MSILDSLITDRTQADVDRAKYLNSLFGYDPKTDTLVWYGTEAELAEWSGAKLKGAYKYTDLNRVGAAMAYVAGRLTAAGYYVPITPKTDWTDEDWMTPTTAGAYLDALRLLRSQYALYDTTPNVPDSMDGLTVDAANDIEKILLDIDSLLENIMASWYYSGEVYCGEV